MLNDADGQGCGNASDYEAREPVADAEALFSKLKKCIRSDCNSKGKSLGAARRAKISTLKPANSLTRKTRRSCRTLYASDPLRNKTGILAGCHAAVRVATACEQELAGAVCRWTVIDRPAGLLNSNLTGRSVFFCRTIARSAVYRPAATSSTLMATTSQPRSLLSIARLNMARSRARPPIWSFVRIEQTCLGRSGGFAAVSFPLFHGIRLGAEVAFT
jgi:hypothetical protein